MTTVIEHGTVSANKYRGCKCLACCNATAAYEARRYRQKGYGTWCPLVDAGPARKHIEALHAAGMTWRQIADRADVKVEYLRQLRMNLGRRHRTERIRPERAAALLALTYQVPTPAPRSNVAGLGTVRRLQALRANGWPAQVLAARTGVARHTIGVISKGQELVFAATAEQIAELYDDLHDQDPRRHSVSSAAAGRAIREATQLGWTPPRAWDNVDIDDPKAEPGSAAGRRYAVIRDGDRRRHEIVEDAGELIAQGLPRDVIAERIGASWDAIRAAHSRCGVPLPAVAS